MQRCLQLALKGAGFAAPNPLVGAVLVHNGRIIGEGWHRQYGGPHAEVNCLASVLESDKPFIRQSVLYVSLEPCNHTGKTPPCTDKIINQQIPEVVIGCADPFALVNGAGIARLREAGIIVTTGILESECAALNRRFFTFHQRQRPYIVLKWAQTHNGKISGGNNERLRISNDVTNQLVHRWRSEEAAIMVGRQTALLDNPQLSNRHWSGAQPTRLVVDRHLQLPKHLHLFDRQQPTIVLNTITQAAENNLRYEQIAGADFFTGMLQALHGLHLQSVLVEGGAVLLQLFINSGCWDEARIITNTNLMVNEGLDAPLLTHARILEETEATGDRVVRYQNTKTSAL